MNREFNLGRSESGLPTLCEGGGGRTNTGDCICVAGPDGSPKRALWARCPGRANDNHAVFAVAVGDTIAEAERERGELRVTVYCIKRIDGDTAIAGAVGWWKNGEYNMPHHLRAVAVAALEKCQCYHCREPHLALPPASLALDLSRWWPSEEVIQKYFPEVIQPT